jgi:hypothetical protein
MEGVESQRINLIEIIRESERPFMGYGVVRSVVQFEKNMEMIPERGCWGTK